jgi:hypothetical protein
MRVFVSWSGTRSHAVASALRAWLPAVLPRVEPWLSSMDIRTGTRWSEGIEYALRRSHVGILCVTPENQTAPWMVFEAGAIANAASNAVVCPYLIGMQPSQMTLGPLSSFQAATATQAGTLELLRTVNDTTAKPLSLAALTRRFDRYWPTLKQTLDEQARARNISTLTAEDKVQRLLAELLRRLPPPTLEQSEGSASRGASCPRPEELAAFIAGSAPSAEDIAEYGRMSSSQVRAELERNGIDPHRDSSLDTRHDDGKRSGEDNSPTGPEPAERSTRFRKYNYDFAIAA